MKFCLKRTNLFLDKTKKIFKWILPMETITDFKTISITCRSTLTRVVLCKQPTIFKIWILSAISHSIALKWNKNKDFHLCLFMSRLVLKLNTIKLKLSIIRMFFNTGIRLLTSMKSWRRDQILLPMKSIKQHSMAMSKHRIRREPRYKITMKIVRWVKMRQQIRI